jgi:hypothetical protein
MERETHREASTRYVLGIPTPQSHLSGLLHPTVRLKDPSQVISRYGCIKILLQSLSNLYGAFERHFGVNKVLVLKLDLAEFVPAQTSRTRARALDLFVDLANLLLKWYRYIVKLFVSELGDLLSKCLPFSPCYSSSKAPFSHDPSASYVCAIALRCFSLSQWCYEGVYPRSSALSSCGGETL